MKPRRKRDRGVAMLIVLTWLALMVAVVGEFTYGTSVESAQAANARDELRAHYLARSSVNLARSRSSIRSRSASTPAPASWATHSPTAQWLAHRSACCSWRSRRAAATASTGP